MKEVSELRALCESDNIRLPQQEKGFEEKAVHLLELTTKHELFLNLAKSEQILVRIRPLLGNDIHLKHPKIATKPPSKGVGAFKMHQDFAFFPHTNTDLLAVMVMLDAAAPKMDAGRWCPAAISGNS